MKILKHKTDSGWVPLYTYVLSLLMRKDKNLSDIEDKEEALKNLQLTGSNVTSHSHDSTYLPLIQAAEDNAINQVDQLRLDTDVEIRNIKDSITNANTEIDDKLDKNIIRIQSGKPTDPVEGMIWFSTNSSEQIISVYTNGAWIKYGAVWK